MTIKISSGSARLGLVAAAALLAVGSAAGEDVAVKLTGAQEVPAVDSSAAGAGTISIGKDGSVKGSVRTTGMVGTMAHVHLAAAGKNGPPIISLVQTSENVWSVPENSKLTADQYKSFESGELYVNVHSDQHKGGEIRAQLKP